MKSKSAAIKVLQTRHLENLRVPGLFQRGTGFYYQPRQKDGVRPAMFSLGTDDRFEAIEKVDQYLDTPILTESGTLLAEVKQHLASGYLDRSGQRHDYSEMSRRVKLPGLRRFLDSLPRGLTVSEIKPEHVQRFYDGVARVEESRRTNNEKRKSRATAYKLLVDIQAFCSHLVRTKKLRFNPVGQVETMARIKAPPVRFCLPELRDSLIANAPSEDLKLILMLGFHAGLRKNEIVEARPEWVNFETNQLDLQDTETKHFNMHKKARPIPLKPVLREFLQSYGLRSPYLLRPEVRQKKGPCRYHMEIPFRTYMKAQGVPWVKPHTMRHTYASLYVMGGKSIYLVAAWLGDTVKVAMDTYVHLAPRDEDGQGSL